jgi:hypothetical protein
LHLVACENRETLKEVFVYVTRAFKGRAQTVGTSFSKKKKRDTERHVYCSSEHVDPCRVFPKRVELNPNIMFVVLFTNGSLEMKFQDMFMEDC